MGFLDEMSSFFSMLRKMKDPELMEQMLKFQKSCSEFMMENDQLKEEIRKLKEKLSSLEKQLEIKDSVTLKMGTYFLKDDGPFCTKCFDVDKNLVRLIVQNSGLSECPNCKNYYDYKYNG